MRYEQILSLINEHIQQEKELMQRTRDPKRENLFRHGVDVLQKLKISIMAEASK